MIIQQGWVDCINFLLDIRSTLEDVLGLIGLRQKGTNIRITRISFGHTRLVGPTCDGGFYELLT